MRSERGELNIIQVKAGYLDVEFPYGVRETWPSPDAFYREQRYREMAERHRMREAEEEERLASPEPDADGDATEEHSDQEERHLPVPVDRVAPPVPVHPPTRPKREPEQRLVRGNPRSIRRVRRDERRQEAIARRNREADRAMLDLLAHTQGRSTHLSRTKTSLLLILVTVLGWLAMTLFGLPF